MNSECTLNSTHTATPQFEQPRRTASPPEDAAAGDAPRGQISLDLNLCPCTEVFAIDPSLMEITTKNDSGEKCKFNGYRTCANASQLWNSSKLKEIVTDVPDIEVINLSQDRNMDKFLSSNRKIPMFSEKIWNEKVLSTETFFHPEPELVEIYFDKKKVEDRFIRSGINTSIDLSEELESTNELLSAPKSKTSSSGHGTNTFDDEIWPVSPKLIPTANELSIPISENRFQIITPEKLIDNDDKVAAMVSLSLQDTNMKGGSSKSSIESHELVLSSEIEEVIQPTHEIEFQNDFDSKCSNDSSSMMPKASFDHTPYQPGSIANLFNQTCLKSALDESSRPEPPKELRSSQDSKMVSPCRQEIKEIFAITRDHDPKIGWRKRFTNGRSESVSTVLGDLLKSAGSNDFLSDEGMYTTATHCNGKVYLGEPELKLNEAELTFSNLHHASPTDMSVKRCSPVRTDEVLSNPFAATSFAISRDMDDVAMKKYHEENEKSSSVPQSSINKVHSPLGPSIQDLNATKLASMEMGNLEQNINKSQKCAKVIRFEASAKRRTDRMNGIVTQEDEDFDERASRRSLSNVDEVKSPIDNKNCTTSFTDTKSFKQRIGQLSQETESHFKVLDDAVDTLVKVEIIIASNCRTMERLQHLQPTPPIPQLTPSDEEKSIAKALMRCRNYTKSNGYSYEATYTINKLLTTTVQSLKRSVKRQKLALAALEKCCAATCGKRQGKKSYQASSLNAMVLIAADEIGTSQVQSLISDVLTLTEAILPKIVENDVQKKSLLLSNNLHRASDNFTNHDSFRVLVDTTGDKFRRNNVTNGLKIELNGHASTEAKDNDRTKDSIHSDSQNSPLSLKISSNRRKYYSDQQSTQHQEQRMLNTELEISQSLNSQPTRHKESTSTEPAKALKRMFNDLYDKRSKTLPRHSNINDSTNHSRSLSGPRNHSIALKLPAWKPGGNNFVHLNTNVNSNNPKTRQPPPSTASKKKIMMIENQSCCRDTKTNHQRARMTPGSVRDSTKVFENVTKPYNTASLAKMRSARGKSQQSEVVSLDRSKVKIPSDDDSARAKKPRSKSRTRTKPTNKTPRITVTEIPLEHAEEFSRTSAQKAVATKVLPLNKKTSSSPKDVIQLLEELIRSSGNKTSIQKHPSIQVVARCAIEEKNADQDVRHVAPLKTEIKNSVENSLAPSNERCDQKTDEICENDKKTFESVEETKEPESPAMAIKSDTVFDEKGQTQQEPPCNLHKKEDLSSGVNLQEILSVTGSNNESNASCCTEDRSTASKSNVESKEDLISDDSIGCVFSKCCQASFTSLTSLEFSEELVSSEPSETGVASTSLDKTRKDSQESFDTIEDEDVADDKRKPDSPGDQNAGISHSTIPKKKFFNKHARSLELLKEILSDQGLGVHLLNRAETEVKDRCKGSSSKKRLTTRRFLDQNFLNSIGSSETMDQVSQWTEGRFAPTVFSKLATLSESESNLEQIEVSNMVSANDSATCTDDRFTSDTNETICSKEDKGLLSKVPTVENATQFDIISKTDTCVGDSFVSDMLVSSLAIEEKIVTKESVIPDVSLPSSDSTTPTHEMPKESESLESKLPNDVLEAFKLASLRASNLYTAVKILRENSSTQSTLLSNFDVIQNSNKMHTSGSLEDKIPPSANQTLPECLKNFGKAVSKNDDDNLRKLSGNTNYVPFGKRIEPGTRIPIRAVTVNRRIAKSSNEESPVGNFTCRNTTDIKEPIEKKECSEERTSDKRDKVHLTEPLVLSKPAFIQRITSGNLVDTKALPEDENKNAQNTDVSGSFARLQRKRSRSTTECRLSLDGGSATGTQIETLHFAGKQPAAFVRKTSKVELGDVNVEFNPKSLTINSVSKVVTNTETLIAGSRIKKLLEENLQRFTTDYPINDGKVFKDFRDQLLGESSDEEMSVNNPFAETATSTSCTRLNDYSIGFFEIEDVVNHLLSEVEKIDEFSKESKNCELSTLAPENRPKKSIRRMKMGRVKKLVSAQDQPSILRRKHWSLFRELIVSREYLLSMIYAAICSFVFFCLQFSVHCEV